MQRMCGATMHCGIRAEHGQPPGACNCPNDLRFQAGAHLECDLLIVLVDGLRSITTRQQAGCAPGTE